jgi:AcrR family transcriptional regulator
VALVDAVAAEVAESGSFTAERVAVRAGTSVATFYAYFPSKDLALAAAFSGVLERLVGLVASELRVERLLEQGLPALARRFVRRGVGFFSDEAPLFRLALSRLPVSAVLRDIYREHERVALGHYARFVTLGREAGKLRAGDVDALARALMVLTQGLNNPIALHCESDDPLLELLSEALVDLLSPRPSPPGQGATRRKKR